MYEPVGPKTEAELLGEVEGLAARRSFRGFPAWLELRFERETGARYADVLAKDLLRTVLYYNLMLAGDFLLTPDAVALAAALHFLVVTPAMLLAAWLIRRGLRPLARDLAAASVPLLIACQVLFIFVVSRAETASFYLFFVALNVATVNSAMRLRHRAGAWVTYACFALLPAVMALVHKMPVQVEAMQLISLVNTGVVTLRGMADREREFRRAYLNGLRDRLRIAVSEAEASRDPLTGAANRRGLEAAAKSIWSAGEAEPVAVILFDVDRFKSYNDLYGHPAGDACLKAIAGVAQGRCKARRALLARYGGEEFLALLTGGAAAQAEALAEEVRRAILDLALPHAGMAGQGIVSASFGVARAQAGDLGFEALTAAADAALYAAKAAGRNRIELARAA